jgi:hypothetical protein
VPPAVYTALMRDVSNTFDHYRVSARAIWNTAFWPDVAFRNWDSVEQFDEIQRILFNELVLEKVDKDWPFHDIFKIAMPFFHVVPSGHVPIMIQNPRSERETGYWDHPVKYIKQEEAELHFLSYFDWNRMDYADFRYYRVEIAKFDAHPEIVGREALIDRQHAIVHITNE